MVRLLSIIAGFILMLSLVSCQESKTESMSGSGILRLMATDAPLNFENVSKALITIDEIKVKSSTSGEKTTVMSKTVTLDLLTLRNGLVETLSDIEIPAGKYSEILLIISSASIEMKDGKSFPFKIPSAESSGLKVKVTPDIEITTGMSTDVLLDFDLSRSFVPTMNGQEVSSFNFKPVIRAQLLALGGTVSGQVLNVTDESPIAGATVTVKKGTVVITTAVADSEGFFKILGLPADSYNITAEAVDYGSLTIESVPVTAGNEVTTHFILTPVTPVL
jgi:hypothetical protein